MRTACNHKPETLLSGNSVKFSAVVLLCLAQATRCSSPSEWVTDTGSGLTYKSFEAGNTIMDFSSAGYKNSEMAIPSVSTKATVTPSGGDDASRIQDAIDAVSKLPIQSNGFRGAVQLAASGLFVLILAVCDRRGAHAQAFAAAVA